MRLQWCAWPPSHSPPWTCSPEVSALDLDKGPLPVAADTPLDVVTAARFAWTFSFLSGL